MPVTPVVRPRDHALRSLFGRESGVVIGVVHLLPLPGAPEHDGGPATQVYDRAVQDALAYAQGGVDGLIVENHGDIPFLKPDRIGPETAACMAVATGRVISATGLPTGINVLANAAEVALAIAVAASARFVRVNQWANAYVANEGIIEGPAAQALRYRKALGAGHVRIFADSHVKHGAHAITADRSVAELTRDLEWSGADVVIATGQRTGDAASGDETEAIMSATSLPVVTGSGATADNIAQILSRAQGAIVASSLKRDGVWWNEVEVARVKALLEAASEQR